MDNDEPSFFTIALVLILGGTGLGAIGGLLVGLTMTGTIIGFLIGFGTVAGLWFSERKAD